LTFQGKVEGRKLVGFGEGKAAYDVLLNAQPGEVYEITVVKNGAYNNWTNAVKTTATATTVASPAGGTISGAKPAYTPAAKSTYETPEERAKKQILIVRQSNLSSAISLLSIGAKTTPKVEDILSTAKQFEGYVFGDDVAVVDRGTDGFKDLDDFPDVTY
jgi:hypothetical protein